jgi:hypothetical protein
MKYVTYDDLSGPDLDSARWSQARLPLPTGGEHIPVDPNGVAVDVPGRGKVYEAHGTLIPERARIAFGIYTQLPIRDGRSRSLQGQGMNARWRRFRVAA